MQLAGGFGFIVQQVGLAMRINWVVKERMVGRFPKYWSGPRSDLNLKVYVEFKY